MLMPGDLIRFRCPYTGVRTGVVTAIYTGTPARYKVETGTRLFEVAAGDVVGIISSHQLEHLLEHLVTGHHASGCDCEEPVESASGWQSYVKANACIDLARRALALMRTGKP